MYRWSDSRRRSSRDDGQKWRHHAGRRSEVPEWIDIRFDGLLYCGHRHFEPRQTDEPFGLGVVRTVRVGEALHVAPHQRLQPGLARLDFHSLLLHREHGQREVMRRVRAYRYPCQCRETTDLASGHRPCSTGRARPDPAPFGEHSQSLNPLAVLEAIELLDEMTMSASTLRTVRSWAFEYTTWQMHRQPLRQSVAGEKHSFQSIPPELIGLVESSADEKEGRWELKFGKDRGCVRQ